MSKIQGKRKIQQISGGEAESDVIGVTITRVEFGTDNNLLVTSSNAELRHFLLQSRFFFYAEHTKKKKKVIEKLVTAFHGDVELCEKKKIVYQSHAQVVCFCCSFRNKKNRAEAIAALKRNHINCYNEMTSPFCQLKHYALNYFNKRFSCPQRLTGSTLFLNRLDHQQTSRLFTFSLDSVRNVLPEPACPIPPTYVIVLLSIEVRMVKAQTTTSISKISLISATSQMSCSTPTEVLEAITALHPSFLVFLNQTTMSIFSNFVSLKNIDCFYPFSPRCPSGRTLVSLADLLPTSFRSSHPLDIAFHLNMEPPKDLSDHIAVGLFLTEAIQKCSIFESRAWSAQKGLLEIPVAENKVGPFVSTCMNLYRREYVFGPLHPTQRLPPPEKKVGGLRRPVEQLKIFTPCADVDVSCYYPTLIVMMNMVPGWLYFSKDAQWRLEPNDDQVLQTWFRNLLSRSLLLKAEIKSLSAQDSKKPGLIAERQAIKLSLCSAYGVFGLNTQSVSMSQYFCFKPLCNRVAQLGQKQLSHLMSTYFKNMQFGYVHTDGFLGQWSQVPQDTIQTLQSNIARDMKLQVTFHKYQFAFILDTNKYLIWDDSLDEAIVKGFKRRYTPLIVQRMIRISTKLLFKDRNNQCSDFFSYLANLGSWFDLQQPIPKYDCQSIQTKNKKRILTYHTFFPTQGNLKNSLLGIFFFEFLQPFLFSWLFSTPLTCQQFITLVQKKKPIQRKHFFS